MGQDLLIDSSIRDYVLLPLTLVMLLVGLMRHYATLLLNTAPKRPSMAVLREQRSVQRGALLAQHGNNLPPASFAAFKTHLVEAYKAGTYLQPPPPPKKESEDDQPEMPAGMDGMMEMMKKQAVSFLPQTLIMYWIGSFFDGFVLTKLPFPLTAKFKGMLQRGIDTPDMDASWVSSVSWYFLCLFGLNPVYQLILGTTNAADPAAEAMPLGGMGGGASPAGPASANASPTGGFLPPPATAAPALPLPGAQAGPDYKKLMEKQEEELFLAEGRYVWVAEGVEDRVLELLSR